MPGSKFTRRANTRKKNRQWQHVYDSAKARGASMASAIAQASGVLRKEAKRK